MNKAFWIPFAVLVAIVTALGFCRVFRNKIKEQNIIAEQQLHQSSASSSFFQWISTYATISNLGIPALFLGVGLIMKRKIWVRGALSILLSMDLAPGAIVLSITGALMIMFSRIVLGVHNFTGILGGVTIACLGILIMCHFFEWYPVKKP